ncbi:MAG: hypothetical protein HRT35_03010 [Algicola sp.]|nr:hypothetical protein [Algicola sp.]
MSFDFLTSENIETVETVGLGTAGSIVAAILITVIIRTIKKLKTLFNNKPLKPPKSIIEIGIKEYQTRVNLELLNGSHPWLINGFHFHDTIVPINIEQVGSSHNEPLNNFLTRHFEAVKTPRIMLVGNPGSGKTIAMKMMSIAIATCLHDSTLIPVLLTLTKMNVLNNEDVLKEEIIKQLRFYQFEQNKHHQISAQTYVGDHLLTGNFVLLFDGFDELDATARSITADFLDRFMGANREIPTIFCSRGGVYENEIPFKALAFERIHTIPFNQCRILQFVSLWQFEGTKSAAQLLALIKKNPHLSNLATNPLMLTIMAYTYSLTEVTLPESRGEFYQNICQALLGMWDDNKEAKRASQFPLRDKFIILNQLAFNHICQSENLDDRMVKDNVYEVVDAKMKSLGLKNGKCADILDEIVCNAGLLQEVDLNHFTFAHRTFTEFFAACYIAKVKDKQLMLQLYKKDTVKWQHVLILYLGLNVDQESAHDILLYLASEFNSSAHDDKLRFLVFSALAECTIANVSVSSEILYIADNYLISDSISLRIIEDLALIATASRRSDAPKAKEILLKVMQKEMTDETFREVLNILLPINDWDINKVIYGSLDRINGHEFLANLDIEDSDFVRAITTSCTSTIEKEDIIEGLKEAGKQEILTALMIESTNSEIKQLAAYALLRMSNLKTFFSLLEKVNMDGLQAYLQSQLDKKLREWQWPWSTLETKAGQQAAILLCELSADRIIENQQIIDSTNLAESHDSLRYLTSALLVEKGMPFHKLNLLDFKNAETASKTGLKRHWQKKINLKNTWYRLWNSEDSFFTVFFVFFPYLLATTSGGIGFLLYHLNWQDNAFYSHFFDEFTVKVIFITALVTGILNYFALSLLESKSMENRILTSFLGPIGCAFILNKNKKPVLRWYLVMAWFTVLSIISAIAPFQHFSFNIAYTVCFLTCAACTYDSQQLDLAVIDTTLLTKLYNFLKKSQ